MSTIKIYPSFALVAMADNLWYESHLQSHDLRKRVILVLEKWNAADECEFSG